MHILKLYVEESLLTGDGLRPHVDPVRWRPLIMSFCRFSGRAEEVHPSWLAESDFMRLLADASPNRTALPAAQKGGEDEAPQRS